MESAEYWKKRMSEVEAASHKTGMTAYKEVEDQYQEAQRGIEAQINKWYKRLAVNNGVSLEEAHKMLSSRELEEFKWDVNDYIKHGEENALNQKWMKQLENASARFHINRLEAMKLECQQQIEKAFGNQLDTVDSAMRKIYEDGYYHTAFEIQKGVGVGYSFSRLDTRQIDKVIHKPWAQDGKDFSSRIWSNKDQLVQQCNTTLTQCIMRGQDPQKAIDQMSKRLNVSKSAAGRLVMTESAAFNSMAQQDSFKELGVEQYEIVATLDARTSEICREMDGKHFKMSEYEAGETAPPFHPWCRSTTVPYFDDDFGSVGERAARGADGKTYYIPANMTYRDWQKTFVEGGSKDGLTPTKTDQKPSVKYNR